MGLFDLFLSEEDNEKTRKTAKGTFTGDSKYSEEEMNAYGLTEEEKKEVRKGNYAPWDFETDGELEEDDYYYEDED